MLRAVLVLLGTLLAMVASGACGDDSSVRLVLVPEEGVEVQDFDLAAEELRDAVLERAEVFGFDDVTVAVESGRVVVEAAGVSQDEARRVLGRTGLVHFCEPITNAVGDVAIVAVGTVQYEPQTCRTVRDGDGNLVIDGGEFEYAAWAVQSDPRSSENPPPELIAWRPALTGLGGIAFGYDSELMQNAVVESAAGRYVVNAEWVDAQGRNVAFEVTGRLMLQNHPLAAFLDGERVLDAGGRMIAPNVVSTNFETVSVAGLDRSVAEELAALINAGPYPVLVRLAEAAE